MWYVPPLLQTRQGWFSLPLFRVEGIRPHRVAYLPFPPPVLLTPWPPSPGCAPRPAARGPAPLCVSRWRSAARTGLSGNKGPSGFFWHCLCFPEELRSVCWNPADWKAVLKSLEAQTYNTKPGGCWVMQSRVSGRTTSPQAFHLQS